LAKCHTLSAGLPAVAWDKHWHADRMLQKYCRAISAGRIMGRDFLPDGSETAQRGHQ
jgi:hypothetical protein